MQVCQSAHPLRASTTKGSMAKAYCCATGKLLLTFLEEDQQSHWLSQIEFVARTPYTHRDSESLSKELRSIRSLDYAVDDQEYYEGVRCLAVPIFDREGNATTAVGITAATTRFPKRRVQERATEVKSCVHDIESAWRGRGVA